MDIHFEGVLFDPQEGCIQKHTLEYLGVTGRCDCNLLLNGSDNDKGGLKNSLGTILTTFYTLEIISK